MKVLPSEVYQVIGFKSNQQRCLRKNYETTAHASQMKLFHIVSEDESVYDDNDEEEYVFFFMLNELSNDQQDNNYD